MIENAQVQNQWNAMRGANAIKINIFNYLILLLQSIY